MFRGADSFNKKALGFGQPFSQKKVSKNDLICKLQRCWRSTQDSRLKKSPPCNYPIFFLIDHMNYGSLQSILEISFEILVSDFLLYIIVQKQPYYAHIH